VHGSAEAPKATWLASLLHNQLGAALMGQAEKVRKLKAAEAEFRAAVALRASRQMITSASTLLKQNRDEEAAGAPALPRGPADRRPRSISRAA
jgi:hypothetical protein